MKWIEVRISTTEEAYDAISEMLTSMGAGGVVIEDPNDIKRDISKPGSLDYADDEFLKSLGDDVVVKAYFSEQMDRNELFNMINEKLSSISCFLNVGKGFTGYSEVDDEDWATAWKKHYKTFRLSDRLVVKPSWEEYKIVDNEIVIQMDPGMAFGTGTHETTKMCALMLEKYIKPGNTVIDVGCGTGILSIIAARLGSEKVTAVDVDDMAVRVAGENLILNNVNNRVDVVNGVLSDIDIIKADIIVANIIADVIIDIFKSIPQYLINGGLFITSGIIKDRRQEVIDACLKYDFLLEETMEIGEWVAMVFKCQNSL